MRRGASERAVIVLALAVQLQPAARASSSGSSSSSNYYSASISSYQLQYPGKYFPPTVNPQSVADCRYRAKVDVDSERVSPNWFLKTCNKVCPFLPPDADAMRAAHHHLLTPRSKGRLRRKQRRAARKSKALRAVLAARARERWWVGSNNYDGSDGQPSVRVPPPPARCCNFSIYTLPSVS